MSARTQILGRLKTALDRENRPPTAARERLAGHAQTLIPKRADGDRQTWLRLFQAEAEAVDSQVTTVAGMADVPAAAARLLAAANLEPSLRVAPALDDMDWGGQPLLEVTSGGASGTETTGVSQAFGGVAETGTLVFLSGPDNPTALNYLPPNHIAVVRSGDIEANYEAIWARLRGRDAGKDENPAGFMPRNVNWITGPSRTGDIEQTLLLGAHGPNRLFIIIVDD